MLIRTQTIRVGALKPRPTFRLYLLLVAAGDASKRLAHHPARCRVSTTGYTCLLAPMLHTARSLSAVSACEAVHAILCGGCHEMPSVCSRMQHLPRAPHARCLAVRVVKRAWRKKVLMVCAVGKPPSPSSCACTLEVAVPETLWRSAKRAWDSNKLSTHTCIRQLRTSRGRRTVDNTPVCNALSAAVHKCEVCSSALEESCPSGADAAATSSLSLTST